jgi:hypothetical protein
MKRTDLKKLQLNTTTIRVLDKDALGNVAGGIGRTIGTGCSDSCTNPSASICGGSCRACNWEYP